MADVRVVILDEATGKRRVIAVDEDILNGSTGGGSGVGHVGGLSANYVFVAGEEVGGCDANGD